MKLFENKINLPIQKVSRVKDDNMISNSGSLVASCYSHHEHHELGESWRKSAVITATSMNFIFRIWIAYKMSMSKYILSGRRFFLKVNRVTDCTKGKVYV